jgi:UDP-N-acetylmuramoyl-tripeptide--D-alanyl-D-alanine ligase
MEIAALHKLFKESTGVTTDTRNIAKGNLFFALKGDNFNGNLFAQEALEKGAGYVVIDEGVYASERTILVNDVLETLQALASYHRKQLTIPVIGLTGSNGKTTSKELIHAALSTQFRVQATKGNLNNHIGVPLTLLSIDDTHELAIVEMGANHQKEIAFLCSLSQPTIGYITNFGKAHLEGFGGVEGVIKGKSELYDYLSTSGGTALVNMADPIQVEKTKALSTIRFGTPDTDYYFEPLSSGAEHFLGLEYKELRVHTQLTGAYNFSNLSAAFALALYFNIEPQVAKQGLEAYTPQNNRSQFKQGNHNTLLLDAYNANPSSMEAALQNFHQVEAAHKWVILGDMFELGPDSEEEHQRIAALATSLNFEKVLLAGAHFAALPPLEAYLQFPTTQALLEYLITQQVKEKTILIKGSRGMKLETLVPEL